MIDSQHLDLETVLEAIEALGDGIAIYDENARPLYANAVTLKRFAKMYADMEAGMSYREALEAVVAAWPDTPQGREAGYRLGDALRAGNDHAGAAPGRFS